MAVASILTDGRRAAGRKISVTALFGGMVCALGAVVLFGWHGSNATLIQVVPGLVPMQYNTALGFVLCGGGLLSVDMGQRRLALAIGAVVAALGALTLSQYVLAIDLGIDLLLMDHYVTTRTSHPGRMAPNTALCFTLAGLVLAATVATGRATNGQTLAGVGGAVLTSLGIVAVIGYAIGLEPAYGWGDLTQMALHTAAGMIALGAALTTFAWQADGATSGDIPRWSPAALGVTLATVLISIWSALVTYADAFATKPDRTHTVLSDDVLLAFGLILSVALTVAAMYARTARERAKIAEREVQERRRTETLLRRQTEELMAISAAIREKELETSRAEARLLDALKIIPNGIILFDENDRLVLFNDVMKTINPHVADHLRPGLTFEEYARHNIFGRYRGESPEQLEERLRTVMDRHRELLETGRSTTVDREERPGLWVRRTNNRTAEGGLIGVLTDISDIEKARGKLVEQAEELKRSNTELEQFAYLASHDLQEPLRIIGSYCELLRDRYGDRLDDDARDFIGYAVDGAGRMRSLIDDLLVYSRVGRGDIVKAPVALSEVAEEARERLGKLIPENDATVRIGDLPTVGGDGSLLAQLFQNLISNAIKFHGDRPPEIEILAERIDGGWRLRVSDNGIGIDAAHCDGVFQMFQRLHGRSKYAGNGLGLALCKRVVERHGGNIWIEPNAGCGASVYFTLPDRGEGNDAPNNGGRHDARGTAC